MKTATFTVEGMHCNGCATVIQALLQRSAGVRKVSASFDDGLVRVLYDPQNTSVEQLSATIQQGAYRVTGHRDD